MIKTKAIICTTMLTVLVFIACFVATFVIKNDNGMNLMSFIYPPIAGTWVGEKIVKFYHWLRRRDT